MRKIFSSAVKPSTSCIAAASLASKRCASIAGMNLQFNENVRVEHLWIEAYACFM